MTNERKEVVLAVCREEASKKIRMRIELGNELLANTITSESFLKEEREKYYTWNDYNIELLSRLFTSDDLSEEYSGSGFGVWSTDSTLNDDIEDHRRDIKSKIRRLTSIEERLELIPEPKTGDVVNQSSKQLIANSNKVFIVHGHDEVAKVKVARFIEKIKLKAIILHEQVNKGTTIIEKFENHASQVGFAVVLLTPDDIGYPKNKDTLKQPRARQNVILELGYFAGLLGRDKVCVLTKGDIELPSDYLGVVYTPLDDAGAWELALAREIKESGVDVDLNEIL